MEDLSHHPRRLMVHKLFRIFLEVRVKSSELDGQGVKKAFRTMKISQQQSKKCKLLIMV